MPHGLAIVISGHGVIVTVFIVNGKTGTVKQYLRLHLELPGYNRAENGSRGENGYAVRSNNISLDNTAYCNDPASYRSPDSRTFSHDNPTGCFQVAFKVPINAYKALTSTWPTPTWPPAGPSMPSSIWTT